MTVKIDIEVSKHKVHTVTINSERDVMPPIPNIGEMVIAPGGHGKVKGRQFTFSHDGNLVILLELE